MDTLTFAAVALAVLGYGLVSGRLENSVVTPPMVFVLFGLGAASHGLGIVDLSLEAELIHLIAEVTLVLVLFTDASRIDLRLVKSDHNLPIRLLAIGLPLTIVAGTAVGAFMFPGLGFWEVALLAAILAPTDAALGQAVVSSRLVPVRIRQALNIESGLNDGIALPAVLFIACLASAANDVRDAADWITFGVSQVTLGPLVGVAVGYAGGKLVERASTNGWMTEAFQGLSALALALVAFALAELVHGNGFIAAFAAGLTVGNTARQHCKFLFEFAEAEGQLLTLLIFMIFGAVLVPEAIAHVDLMTALYAGLSLTVIRMVPTALSLIGSGVSAPTSLFLGWFGPRGLASILFALLVIEDAELAAREEILAVTVVTVLFSVFAHGLTAVPAARRYARYLERHKTGAMEHEACTELPTRIARFGRRRA